MSFISPQLPCNHDLTIMHRPEPKDNKFGEVLTSVDGLNGPNGLGTPPPNEIDNLLKGDKALSSNMAKIKALKEVGKVIAELELMLLNGMSKMEKPITGPTSSGAQPGTTSPIANVTSK